MDQIEQLHRGIDMIYQHVVTLEKVYVRKKSDVIQGLEANGHSGCILLNMLGLRKLAEFQRAWTSCHFLIGDGTGRAGDPSGKTHARENFSLVKN